MKTFCYDLAMGQIAKIPAERFVGKYAISTTSFYKGTPCWIWHAAKKQGGYGRFWDGDRVVMAHAFSWEQKNGKLAIGFELDHLCRVHDCINPDHLEAVTHKENCLRGDSIAAYNSTKTHCIRGHELSGYNMRLIPDGSRRCRQCCIEYMRAKKANRLKEWNDYRSKLYKEKWQ